MNAKKVDLNILDIRTYRDKLLDVKILNMILTLFIFIMLFI